MNLALASNSYTLMTVAEAWEKAEELSGALSYGFSEAYPNDNPVIQVGSPYQDRSKRFVTLNYSVYFSPLSETKIASYKQGTVC